MDRILHINAAPRDKDSRTLEVTAAFMDSLKKKYPRCRIDELNVFTEKLPDLTTQRLDGKYVLLGGKGLTPELEKAWKEIITEIERFLAADAYILSAPMWNFSIPHRLKHYIDVIVQPKYLFKYTPSGVEGMAKGRKMVVITSRGGDYSSGSPFSAYDFQEPYLRAVFGFVGITDITFINAQPMDALGQAVREERIRDAQVLARKAAEGL